MVKFRRLSGVILAAGLCLALTACTNNDASKTSSTKSVPSATASPNTKVTPTPKSSAGELGNAQATLKGLVALNTQSFTPLIKVFANAEKLPPPNVASDDQSASIRFDKNFKEAKDGRYEINMSRLTPAICYTDYINKVSMLAAFDEAVMIDLSPQLQCKGDLDGIFKLTFNLDKNNKVIEIPHKKRPKELKGLYDEVIKEFKIVLNNR